MKKILLYSALLFSFFIYQTSFAIVDHKTANSWEQAWPEDPSVPDYLFNQFVFLKNKTIFASTIEGVQNIVFKKEPGMKWVATGTGLPFSAEDCLIIKDKFDNLYLSIFSNTQKDCGIYKSTDQGKSWIHLDLGIWPGGKITALAYDSVHNILYLGLEWDYLTGVYKSVDNGQTWEKTKLPDFAETNDLKVDASGNLYVGTGTTGIYILNYETQELDQITNDDIKGIQKIWIDDANKTIYIATTLVSNSSTVFKSTDGGKTWAKFNDGLPETRGILSNPLEDMAMDKNGNLYVGFLLDDSTMGIFKLPKGSNHWEQFNDGRQPGAGVLSLAIDDNDGSLYAIDRGTFFVNTLKSPMKK